MMKQVLLVLSFAAVASAIPHIASLEESIIALESAGEKLKSRVHDVFVEWKAKVRSYTFC